MNAKYCKHCGDILMCCSASLAELTELRRVRDLLLKWRDAEHARRKASDEYDAAGGFALVSNDNMLIECGRLAYVVDSALNRVRELADQLANREGE